MLLDPKVYTCSRTGADKIGFIAEAGDIVDEFLSSDSDYDIYLNGHTVRVERDYVLQQGDMVNAIHRPAGADPVTISIAVALITAIVTVALLPKAEKPNTQGTTSTSPNNQVSGQTNIARTGEGIPDIKGTIRAYPDLIQSAWYTWEENRRRVRERFCIGESSIAVTEVRDNDTDFDDMTGSTYEVVERAVTTGDIYPVVVDSISDSILYADNQRALDLDYVYLANNGGVNYVIVHAVSNQNIQELLQLDSEDDFTISGTGKTEIDKTFTIDKLESIYTDDVIVAYLAVGPGVEVDVSCYFIPVEVVTDFPDYVSGSCTDMPVFPSGTVSCFPDYIKNSYDDEGESTGVIGEINTGDSTSIDVFTDWTKLNHKDSTVSFTWYLNLLFPAGLIKNNGDDETIYFQMQARNATTLEPSLINIIIDGSYVAGSTDVIFSISGRTSGELGRTVEILQQGPLIDDADKIEFRIKRYSLLDLDVADSYVKIETAYVMNQYDDDKIGDGFTLLDVDAKSDFTNKAQSSRKINCLASRDQWRGIGVWGPAMSTNYNWFSDAIYSDFVDIFGQARANTMLDLDSLYTALDGVDSELKEFNYSYDDADISLGQRIHTACNAARVGAYRDGQTWRFFREESKPVTYHFDRRNIAGNSESQMSFRFQKPNDHDSVRLSYIDPDDNSELHIERKINDANDGFEEGVGVRPLEIDLAGCRNETQAINRAELEIRRLVYQRRTVSERVLDDGLLVDIGDRVRWACIYDGDIVDAEVLEIAVVRVEINGNTATTIRNLRLSERVQLTGDLIGHITDVNGDVHGPYSITSSVNGDYWVEGFDADIALVANNMPTQLGSRVIIGTTENLDYYDFTVTSKTPNSDGTVQVEMIEYNELMFSED